MGLLAMVVAGLVDFALYRLRLHAGRFFEPGPTIILGALSVGALDDANFVNFAVSVDEFVCY